MKQLLKSLGCCLNKKKKQCLHQQARLKELEMVMQNTKEDIEQIEYAIGQIEKVESGERKRRVIPNGEVVDFFTDFSETFDAFQHRFHKHLNYKFTCLLIYGRYQFRSRGQTPGREYLRMATVLTYFKRQRNMHGKTIPANKTS